MTRDQILAELSRAVTAAYPERAGVLMQEVERRLIGDAKPLLTAVVGGGTSYRWLCGPGAPLAFQKGEYGSFIIEPAGGFAVQAAQPPEARQFLVTIGRVEGQPTIAGRSWDSIMQDDPRPNINVTIQAPDPTPEYVAALRAQLSEALARERHRQQEDARRCHRCGHDRHDGRRCPQDMGHPAGCACDGR